jgi:Xaa-Pro aminopeptidase
MRKCFWVVALLLANATHVFAADQSEMRDRRQRAATAFHDGILLVHANVPGDLTEDGFRQDPIFYYFTGLENTFNAVLAIDGQSGESWLFLPLRTPYPYPHMGLQPEVLPGAETAKQLGIEHVVDWSELENFLAKRAVSPTRLYLAPGISAGLAMPANFTGEKAPHIPLWAQWIHQKWPSLELTEAHEKVYGLLSIQDPAEILSVRAAAKATVTAVMAGIHAIAPNKSQRSVEAAVENACWNAGAHGTAFWPWAMSGENAVFPRPFASVTRYDHLNSIMRAGDLVRLDVGCEWEHYQGDLGRTIPVSGRFTEDQRETWNIFVAAYHAGSKALREGVTVDQVFDAWRTELVSHKSAAKTPLAQHAIEKWSDRKNIPFWQVHTINLIAGNPSGALRANTTVAFEPIASVDGQAFYLEDMFLITKDGAELLTPGVPYTAEEIEKAMQ